jgi:hypothetical protein
MAVCPGGPTTLAAQEDLPGTIAVAGTDVFWMDRLYVMKCDVGGCPGGPTKLARHPFGGSLHLAADTTNVYWTTPIVGYGGMVTSCAASGCGDTPTQIAARSWWADFGGPADIATDGTNVFFLVTGHLGSVNKCPANGCPQGSTALAGNGNDLVGIAVDGKNVYWAERTLGAIMMIAK